jgi:hypothetical protein
VPAHLVELKRYVDSYKEAASQEGYNKEKYTLCLARHTLVAFSEVNDFKAFFDVDSKYGDELDIVSYAHDGGAQGRWPDFYTWLRS